MSVNVVPNAGTGEQCECGNHRSKCRFGQMHGWITPFYKEDDTTSTLYRTFFCYACGAECLRERK